MSASINHMSASITGFAVYTQPRAIAAAQEMRLPDRLPAGLAIPMIGLFSLVLWAASFKLVAGLF